MSTASSGDAVRRLLDVLDAIGTRAASLSNATQASSRDAEAFQGIADEVARNAGAVDGGTSEALERVAQANRELDTMGGALHEATEGYAALARSLENAHQEGARLGQLVERVAEVPRAARRIIDLSNSANMLALNATIEAERAGAAQAGGFRVVAREMKDLARQIRAFAEDIDKLTREVATDLADGAQALTQSLDRCDADRASTADVFERLPQAREGVRASLESAQVGVEAASTGARQVSEQTDSLRALALRQIESAQTLDGTRSELQSAAESALTLVTGVVGSEGPTVVDLEPGEALRRMGDMDHLIDVRTAEEYVGELGHIEGTRLETIDDGFAHKIGHLPRHARILFICRSGGRSTRAANKALELGFTTVFNLAGGMLRWNEEKLPVVGASAPSQPNA